ncbi:glycosyltransferase family 2 protein [Photobacterium galatheae]|uniref:Glycosyltransferase n=1 Tax=Photobacterium galatheae TaxID=1654360 RepID=A0A066RNL6_9GAMM|nr:glycosyltransferase family 2 protein [Photobacterium galatheae]KDM90661.1 glycosyltransferase [Photobacterium galatheae]MCM0150643.1 glycosyltransferase family 2 protein [Photobacterium galatheae]
MVPNTSRTTLGVLMIIKNEAKHLAACLDTVAGWVDEIVIVDSGSTDDSETIARRYTDKFFSYPDWPGFGPQRQRAQSHMTTDWVLVLDADERVTPELKAEIQATITANPTGIAYKLNRLSDAFGKTIRYSGWSPDWVIRLYRREETQYNDALVHEKVVTDNLTLKPLNGRLLHFTYDNLHHYINKTTKYLKAWTDEREGRKKAGLGTALLHAFASFLKMYVLKRGFLDGRHGFILAWLSMHSTFVKYIDLWLRDYQKERNQ